MSTRKSVIVIFTSGLLKLISNYNLDKNKIPDAMVTHKGFVVNESVRNLMSYVRKELKGIEALTYLLESNDSPKNLFIYRDSLYRKLDALSHWKTNVRLVKVEPHAIVAQELVSISKGEYGLY